MTRLTDPDQHNEGAVMDGLNRRGHPRRSLWSAFYLAALVMGPS